MIMKNMIINAKKLSIFLVKMAVCQKPFEDGDNKNINSYNIDFILITIDRVDLLIITFYGVRLGGCPGRHLL